MHGKCVLREVVLRQELPTIEWVTVSSESSGRRMIGWNSFAVRPRTELMDTRPASGSLKFGDYEIDVEAQELRRNGTPIKLQPQPFKVLLLLATHAGRPVTREEIRQHLWGEDTFVDFDQGMNFCIKQIREALKTPPAGRCTSRRCPGVGTGSGSPSP